MIFNVDAEIIIGDRFPEVCPICEKSIVPNIIHNEPLKGTSEKGFNSIFRCPCPNCQSLFIATYREVVFGGVKMLTGTYPRKPKNKDFSKTISDLSPEFCNIYNEAFNAQQFEFMRICGPGYRKALEFLIKDYVISMNEGEKDEIEKKPLNKCINDYVSDSNIKACAARAVWLGNDETHYVRKWGEKDIEDMKRLIELTVRWIESEIMTREYITDMAHK